MDPVVQQIAKEYKAALQEIYGDDLAELILFGSYARGDQHEESDVDFAVVFRDEEIRPTAQLFKTAPIASELSLKYGLMVSTLPVSLDKKENSMLGIYQEIRKDGIAI
jgi:predicted nucleotidyltransferase